MAAADTAQTHVRLFPVSGPLFPGQCETLNIFEPWAVKLLDVRAPAQPLIRTHSIPLNSDPTWLHSDPTLAPLRINPGSTLTQPWLHSDSTLAPLCINPGFTLNHSWLHSEPTLAPL